MKAAFIKAIEVQSSLSNRPFCFFADALLVKCRSTKMILHFFSLHMLLLYWKLHLLLWLFCTITHSFAPPSALPCPSLFFFPPLLFLSDTLQVVTYAATVAVQSPASPTWLAPSFWWISSSTSKEVEEIEWAVYKPFRGREGGNRVSKSRNI